MVNRGNMCYLHVILQALLFSHPFFRLLRQLDPLALTLTKSTPVLETMYRLLVTSSTNSSPLLTFLLQGSLS